MCKYLIIFIGILVIATSAFGAESVKKKDEVQHFGQEAVEEVWSPDQIIHIGEDFNTTNNKFFKSKLIINLVESENISIPLTVKIKKFEIPKVKLIFKITF